MVSGLVTVTEEVDGFTTSLTFNLLGDERIRVLETATYQDHLLEQDLIINRFVFSLQTSYAQEYD